MEIKLIEIGGFKALFDSQRSPKKSGHKSDTIGDFFVDVIGWNFTRTKYSLSYGMDDYLEIGVNDLKLASGLTKLGDCHAKANRSIDVWIEITAPRYFWQDWVTYTVGVLELDPTIDCVALPSESTNHRILKDCLCVEDFEVKDEDDRLRINLAIGTINDIKARTDLDATQKILKIKKILPESYKQKRGYKLTYQAIRRILQQRDPHILPEFKVVCDFFKSLPLAAELLLV